MSLTWTNQGGYEEAILGTKEDGVSFTLEFYRTCYRRGQWKLMIEIVGPNEVAWGCFDDQDSPMRYYHLKDSALKEADAIAAVLWKDRYGKTVVKV